MVPTDETRWFSRESAAAGSPEGARASVAPDVVASSADNIAPRLADLGDARLVERVRNGDDEAFAALVMRYEAKLIRVLARLTQDRELARDLAQETFWKVYNRLDRFDSSRRFGPWLFRIGVNLCFDALRRHDGPPTLSLDARDGVPAAVDVVDPDPRAAEDLAQEVRFVLEQLPLPQRAILVLRDLEGFSSAEVAAIVGRRETTIRWRLARARETFRACWEQRQKGPGGEACPTS
ncbi:MAG: sigma-70 family RNA polymerase sigma factor [Planctomycetota bacterium]|nr:sigma-70 family RNA polymerase sigma factor [Planctomycetota bacterium]